MNQRVNKSYAWNCREWSDEAWSDTACAGYAGETKDGYYQPLEKAEMVRSGRDVTILCYSRMRYVVMQAVAELEKQGYDPEARSATPFGPTFIVPPIDSLPLVQISLSSLLVFVTLPVPPFRPFHPFISAGWC